MIPYFSKNTFIMKVMESKVTSMSPGKVSLLFPTQTGRDVKQPFEFMLGCMDVCKILAIQHQATANNITIDKIVMSSRAIYNKDFILGEKKETDTEKNTYSEVKTNATIYSSESDKQKLREIVLKGVHCSPIANTLRLAGIKMESEYRFL